MYGRNKEEITINNYYTSKSSPYRTAITGLVSLDGSENSTQDLNNVAAYNTENGMKASTTGNITGVYDLSGGLWERTAGYISNGNNYLYKDGTSGSGYSSGNLMGGTSEANPNGYLTLSTRDYTVYPYNSSKDYYSNNYNTYKGLLTSTYGYGDAILETSSSGSGNNSWNNDYSLFANASSPFFRRGRLLRWWFWCWFVLFLSYVRWCCQLRLWISCGARC